MGFDQQKYGQWMDVQWELDGFGAIELVFFEAYSTTVELGFT